MNDLSFEIKCSKDFYIKLKAEYEDYKRDTTSSRLAINFAMNAWHIIDWIYHEDDSSKLKLGDYQNDIKNKCLSLQIMHDVTNGSKHFKLNRHIPEISKTRHVGTFDSTFDSTFDRSRLEIVMKDGTILDFEVEAKKVMDYWENKFST
ncbi:MAG: hypothetical protein KA797_02790 [Chitinophagales bacterium]|nr:hypothetical protein [Chitinophagales bacterium]